MCDQCQQVQQTYDLDTKLLFKTLLEIRNQSDKFRKKRQELSEEDRLIICSSLLGYSPKQISKMIKLDEKGVRTRMSRTINSYIKTLMNWEQNNKPNWIYILNYLLNNGYKINKNSEDYSLIFNINYSGKNNQKQFTLTIEEEVYCEFSNIKLTKPLHKSIKQDLKARNENIVHFF